jgi:hypothetical protein
MPISPPSYLSTVSIRVCAVAIIPPSWLSHWQIKTCVKSPLFEGTPPCVRASFALAERTILVRRGRLGVRFARRECCFWRLRRICRLARPGSRPKSTIAARDGTDRDRKFCYIPKDTCAFARPRQSQLARARRVSHLPDQDRRAAHDDRPAVRASIAESSRG